MDIEVLVGVIAVFVSGTGIGVGATLFTQWAHKKLTWHPPDPSHLHGQQLSGLRGELDDLAGQVRDLNQRVDFQERLLAGGTRKE